MYQVYRDMDGDRDEYEDEDADMDRDRDENGNKNGDEDELEDEYRDKYGAAVRKLFTWVTKSAMVHEDSGLDLEESANE